ncbi:MAG: hypothetical protein ACRDPH_12375 [Marmoricola sp.]
MKRIVRRVVLPLGAAVALGTSGFAFMAANSVPASHAGEGNAAISGYAVSGIHYDLMDHGILSTDMYIKDVQFTLDQPPVNVKNVYAVIQDGTYNNRNWHKYGSCSVSGSTESTTTFTCGISPGQYSSASLENSTHLTVVASQ